MTARIPEPPSDFEAEGIPDPGDNTSEQAAAGEQAYELDVPRDTPVAADDYGTTAEEQHNGEPLDLRLAHE